MYNFYYASLLKKKNYFYWLRKIVQHRGPLAPTILGLRRQRSSVRPTILVCSSSHVIDYCQQTVSLSTDHYIIYWSNKTDFETPKSSGNKDVLSASKIKRFTVRDISWRVRKIFKTTCVWSVTLLVVTKRGRRSSKETREACVLLQRDVRYKLDGFGD